MRARRAVLSQIVSEDGVSHLLPRWLRTRPSGRTLNLLVRTFGLRMRSPFFCRMMIGMLVLEIRLGVAAAYKTLPQMGRQGRKQLEFRARFRAPAPNSSDAGSFRLTCFSAKAAMPSFWSSVAKVEWKPGAQNLTHPVRAKVVPS